MSLSMFEGAGLSAGRASASTAAAGAPSLLKSEGASEFVPTLSPPRSWLSRYSSSLSVKPSSSDSLEVTSSVSDPDSSPRTRERAFWGSIVETTTKEFFLPRCDVTVLTRMTRSVGAAHFDRLSQKIFKWRPPHMIHRRKAYDLSYVQAKFESRAMSHAAAARV